MSIITAEVQVDETDIVNVKLDQPAEVTIDAIPNQTFKGKVTEMAKRHHRSTGVSTSRSIGGTQEAKDFKVVITLTDPPSEPYVPDFPPRPRSLPAWRKMQWPFPPFRRSPCRDSQ